MVVHRASGAWPWPPGASVLLSCMRCPNRSHDTLRLCSIRLDVTNGLRIYHRHHTGNVSKKTIRTSAPIAIGPSATAPSRPKIRTARRAGFRDMGPPRNCVEACQAHHNESPRNAPPLQSNDSTAHNAPSAIDRHNGTWAGAQRRPLARALPPNLAMLAPYSCGLRGQKVKHHLVEIS